MAEKKKRDFVVDERVAAMLVGQSAAMKLVVLQLVFLAPAEILEAVFGLITDRSLDLHKQVHGKPLLHWMGKLGDAPIKEGFDETQARDILDALADRGVKLDDPPAPPTKPAAATEPVQTKPTANSSPAANTQTPPEEATIAGYKVKDLAGKPDKELLALEGVSKATIEFIRKYEAEQKAAAEAKGTA